MAADITAHQVRNCADDVRLFARPMSQVYFGDVYTPVHAFAARRSRLRSADHGDIVVPRARSTLFGCRSFRVCGPTIRNRLPQHLRSTDTIGNRLHIGSTAGYLSARTAEGKVR